MLFGGSDNNRPPLTKWQRIRDAETRVRVARRELAIAEAELKAAEEMGPATAYEAAEQEFYQPR